MTLTDKLSTYISRFNKKYSQSNSEGKRNPWVLGWFGIVAVFLGVNAIFIVLAITSSPGLVIEDYYEQGRQYEKNAIKRLVAHNKLQWESKMEVPDTITLNKAGTYRFSAVDSRGLPVKDADVQVVAYRPSDANADFTTTLQPIAPGLYQASLSFPLPGIWDLNIKVQRGEDRLEMVQRLSVTVQTGTIQAP
jgi:nitrogen fixation protein FixH